MMLTAIIALYAQYAFAQSYDVIEEPIRLDLVSDDGTVRIHVESNLPKENSTLVIDVKFSNTVTGNLLHDVNYDIIVMQNGEIVLSQLGMYAKNGESQHTTASLSTDSHVEVMIILQGIGSSAPYSGPKGQMIEAEIVPEFGPMSVLILLFATSAAIAVPRMYRLRAAA